MKKFHHSCLLLVRSSKFLLVTVFIGVIASSSFIVGPLTLLTSPYVTDRGTDGVKLDKQGKQDLDPAFVEDILDKPPDGQDLDSELITSLQSQLSDLVILPQAPSEMSISQDLINTLVDLPSFGVQDGSSTGVDSSTIVLEKTDSMIKTQTTYTDDSVLTSTKTMIGKPKLTIINSDVGELDDLVIPIIREKKQSVSSSIRTVKKEVSINFISGSNWRARDGFSWLEEERRYGPWYHPLYEYDRDRYPYDPWGQDRRTAHRMIMEYWYLSTFQLDLKLEVEISYPEECFVDHPYELKVAIRPLQGNLSLRIIPITPFTVTHSLFEEAYREVNKYNSFIDWLKGNKAEEIVWGWTDIETLSFFPTPMSVKFNFLTPLGDQPAVIDQRFMTGTTEGWGKFRWDQGDYSLWESPAHHGTGGLDDPRLNEKPQLIEWIKLKSLSGAIFCDRVTAQLAVSTDGWDSNRLMAWGEEHTQDPTYRTAKDNLINDLADGSLSGYYWNPEYTLNAFKYGRNGEDYNSLQFTLPSHTSGSSVRFAVSDLQYCLERLTFNPTINLQALAFHESPGQVMTVPPGGILPKETLREISCPVPFPRPRRTLLSLLRRMITGEGSSYPQICSSFYYSTGTSVPVLDANYDFDMQITPLNEPSSIDRGQVYSVELSSLGNNEDFIELQVKNLPVEFTASFDRDPVAYDISPSRNNTALLTIHAPDYPSVPPDPLSFSLVATSQGKSMLKNSKPSIMRSVEYTPPVTHGLEFNLDQPSGEVISVSPGEVFSIGFTGTNLGNVPDNVTVRGVLQGVGGTTREWNSKFSVDRYSTAAQSFTGVLNLTYHPTDYFPPPGAYTLNINVTSEYDPSSIQSSTRVIEFLPYFNILSTLTPNTTTLFANYEQEFNLTMTNTGNVVDNYTISADGWTDYLSLEKNRIENFYHGDTHSIAVRLSIPDPTVVPVQVYTFRIIIRSEGDSEVYSLNEVTVNFLEPDVTPPGFSGKPYSGLTIVYPLSSLSLGPSWIPLDENSDSYTIYVNSTTHTNGGWTSGETIDVIMKDVPSYGVGLFNVTAIFNDTTGNEHVDMVWVQIDPTDSNPPLIDPIQLLWPQASERTALVLATGNNFALPVNWNYTLALNWQYTEAYPLKVTLFLNETAIPQEEYLVWRDPNSPLNAWNATYILSPGSLVEETWNFTLAVYDMNGFNVSSALLLAIGSADTSEPVLINSPGSNAIQGHGEKTASTATDSYPHYWTVVVRKNLQLSGTWDANIPVNISVDDLHLKVGVNTLELHIYDIAGNFYNHTWDFTLTDVDSPLVISSPSDMVVFEHNSSRVQHPFWTVEDTNPAKYSIYMNDTLLHNGTWAMLNNTVFLPIDYLRRGTYEFRAVFNDTSNNENSSSFILTVKDVIPPAIVPLKSISYEQFHTPNWFEFIVDESNPKSYQLYRNEAVVDEGDILPSFKVVLVDLDYLPVGDYNFTLRMTDDSGNVGIGAVDVTVLDYSPPFIDGPPLIAISEDSSGNTLEWTINELNPKAYSLYRNGSLVDSDPLTDQSTNITYSIDGLGLGTYEFIIVVEDQYGLIRSLTSFVKVIDITYPQIHSVGEYLAELGDSSAKVVWNVTEKHPATYQIEVDGITQQEGLWSGDLIELPLVGWAEGTYVVKLVVTDGSGNSAWDEVTVTVEDSRKLLTSVSISSPGWTATLVLVSLITIVSVLSWHRSRKKKG